MLEHARKDWSTSLQCWALLYALVSLVACSDPRPDPTPESGSPAADRAAFVQSMQASAGPEYALAELGQGTAACTTPMPSHATPPAPNTRYASEPTRRLSW